MTIEMQRHQIATQRSVANLMELQSSTEAIGPELAAQYLGRNTKNRKLRQGHVRWLADQMAAGEWVLNGESIKFVGNDLVDGQHRLAAIIKSQSTIKTVVIRIPASKGSNIFDTVDTGLNRQTSDILHLAGESNANIVGGTIRMLEALERSALKSLDGINYHHVKLSHQRVLRLLNEKYPDVRAAATFAASNKPALKGLVSPVIMATTYYLFSQINEDDARSYFDKLMTGANLTPRNPLLILRNRLIQDRNDYQQRSRSAFRAHVTLGMMIKAWNLYRMGKTCSHIRFGVNEEMPKPI